MDDINKELEQAQAQARDATDILFALVRTINGAYEAQGRVRFLQQQKQAQEAGDNGA